jgi:hypothetical protein
MNGPAFNEESMFQCQVHFVQHYDRLTVELGMNIANFKFNCFESAALLTLTEVPLILVRSRLFITFNEDSHSVKTTLAAVV